MSFVWNVMLSFSNEEFWRDDEENARERCDALDHVNKLLPAGCKLVDLTKPTFKEGVGYGMEANVYGGGFKHFDVAGFIAIVAAQKWQNPDNVQVFLKAETDDRFEVYLPCKRKRKQGRKSDAGSPEI